MAKVLFLGTAASIPSRERDNTSFLFIHKKEYFLIDCPGSVVQKLKKVNIDYKKVDKIILTHHHPDHIYGLPHFIHARIYTKNPLYIFSNNQTLKLVKKMLTLLNLNKKDYPPVRYKNVFKDNTFFSKNNLILRAIRNKHKGESFGVLFLWRNKSLLYSSDTAISSNIIKAARKSTYLIHDCTASASFFKRYPELYKMHTNSFDLARIFMDSGIKKIIPVHFLLLDELEEKRIKKELKCVGNKLAVPADYESYIL